ncbi:uncharacterized protein LOC124280423 isoform X2 [Haliotis rubra]|uniref:uncharacterized protein LOC124280423 isoform X2 n=1 Tax=Haliotis rubra TaxID=36100 RepID=UPI001EE61F53|nr:uncharacterized protein LOC124280423 isoform X2 [Haliotis rubra]
MTLCWRDLEQTRSLKVTVNGACLVAVYWEDHVTEHAVSSSITLAPKHRSADFERRMSLHVDTTNGRLFHFVSLMFQTFKARLIHVRLSPISFIFQHEDNHSMKAMRKNARGLRTIFQRFMSHLAHGEVEMKIRLVNMSAPSYASRWCFTNNSQLHKTGSTESVVYELSDVEEHGQEGKSCRSTEISEQRHLVENNPNSQKHEDGQISPHLERGGATRHQGSGNCKESPGEHRLGAFQAGNKLSTSESEPDDDLYGGTLKNDNVKWCSKESSASTSMHDDKMYASPEEEQHENQMENEEHDRNIDANGKDRLSASDTNPGWVDSAKQDGRHTNRSWNTGTGFGKGEHLSDLSEKSSVNKSKTTLPNSYEEQADQILSLDITVSKTTDGNDGHAILHQLREVTEDVGGNCWTEVEHILHGESHAVPTAGKGTDTLLCLDTSGDMGRLGLQRLQRIAYSFIEGIENNAEEYGVEENICILVFGRRPGILHPFSNDYESLKEAVEEIEYGGYSPFLHYMLVCVAALTKGGVCDFGGYLKVPPRMVVVTDGITPFKREQVQDAQGFQYFTATLMQIMMNPKTERVVSPIVFVPHGNAQKSLMQSTADMCLGVIVEDVKTICNHQRVQILVAQIIKFVKVDPALRVARVKHVDLIVDAVCQDLSIAEKTAVMQKVSANLDMDFGATDVFDNVNISDDLPPLGKRVMRGPDWTWKNEDTEGTGTIVNHAIEGAYIWVHWDNGTCNWYRYGANGQYNVLLVDDHPRLPDGVEPISIGMEVQPGPDMETGSCDDNQSGTVIRLIDARVLVIWENQSICEHRYGENGKYDVLIRLPLQNVGTHRQSASYEDGALRSSHDTKLHPTKTEDQGAYQWQWFDEIQSEWRPYSEVTDAKLKTSFMKRPNGSCLLQRDGQSFRVSFTKLTERSMDKGSTTAVRKFDV